MSRFESGCRRLRRCTQTGEGICLESRQAGIPTWGFKSLHLRYAPVAHLEEASGLSPVKGGFKSLREYIPLYQNGIWIRLRFGGLRVQIPPRVFFGMWRNGRRAVLRPQSARLRVRLPPYRLQGGLPQRKTGPVQTRFSEGSNPLSFIYNQQERGN